jgi:methanogenic corrinoid protein MtbC1
MNPEPYIEALYQSMLDSDRKAAATVINQALTAGLTPEQVLMGILDPALAKVGVLWECRAISLAQGFVGAKIAEDTLSRCSPEHLPPQDIHLPPVVIGNIEDDFHSLGRRMVASFLRAAGWQVHDLGNDVLPEHFLNKALEVGAPIIGASAMMHTTALNICKLRDLIDQRGLASKIKLAVGGAVFNWRPELVEEVGGDGSATNAAAVNALFRSMLSLPQRGSPA